MERCKDCKHSKKHTHICDECVGYNEFDKKEECGWCKDNKYRFEFNWIDENGITVTTKDNFVIGGIADYCPVCGRKII